MWVFEPADSKDLAAIIFCITLNLLSPALSSWMKVVSVPGQREGAGEVLWWNRKSDSFCKAISHMIGTVPSLAPITTPVRLIFWFCLFDSVPQSLQQSI